MLELIEKHRNELRIPRQCVRLVKVQEPAQRTAHLRTHVGASTVALPQPRPAWDRRMTAAEVQQLEKEAFLDWRRALARCGRQRISRRASKSHQIC